MDLIQRFIKMDYCEHYATKLAYETSKLIEKNIAGKEHSPEIKRCQKKLVSQGKSESSAWAICIKAAKEAGKSIFVSKSSFFDAEVDAWWNKCLKSVRESGGAKDPEAVCAEMGRKKFGKERFQKAAGAGRSEASKQENDEDEDEKKKLEKDKKRSKKDDNPEQSKSKEYQDQVGGPPRETEGFFRDRQRDPAECKSGSFRTIEKGGKKLILCKSKDTGKMIVQSIMTPK